MTGVPAALDRRAGRWLAAFGATGLVLALALMVTILLTFGSLALSASNLEGQRTSAIASLDAAAEALDALSTAAGNAATSLDQSETSVRDAAAVTGQLADALGGLASLSGAFADVATRSRSLSEDLTRTADTMQVNRADSLIATEQVRTLAERVRDLRASLGASGGDDTIARLGPALLLVQLILLVGWLGVAALACLVLGRRVMRRNPQP